MKKYSSIFRIMSLMVALTTVMFSCVDDDYDTPPISQIPVGNVYTIAQLKEFYNSSNTTYTFNDDASVYATVTMDNETDNSYRTFFIQDGTTAIAVYQDVSGGVYIGDSVRVYLKDLVVMKYSGLFQINSIAGDGINVDENLIKQGTNNKRIPEIATIEEINNEREYWQGRLVKIENVQFVDTDTADTYADPINLETMDKLIQDKDDNQLIVRTSGYASFAGTNIPDGSGSIIAVVGQYVSSSKDVMQLYIRRLSEVEMDNARFGITSGGGTGDGSGTFEDPYNVAEAINSSETGVWVEGYLVGVYETVDAGGNTLSEFVPSFTSPFYTNSNVIIADSDSETDISNCIVIQVPSGDIRTAVNMVDNSGNLGKLIMFKGDRETYFGEDGLKNVDGYWLDGTGVIPATGFFEEDFSTSLGSFTTYSVTGSSQVWEHSSQYTCAMMTGYDGGSRYANNDWLISPAIDLTGKSNVTLSFVHAIGYGNYSGIENELKVFVSDDYSGTGDPTAATWTELSFTMPADLNTYFTWTNSGDIDLSAYDGKNNVYFAFNYNCGTANASTWEIKDVVLSDGTK